MIRWERREEVRSRRESVSVVLRSGERQRPARWGQGRERRSFVLLSIPPFSTNKRAAPISRPPLQLRHYHPAPEAPITPLALLPFPSLLSLSLYPDNRFCRSSQEGSRLRTSPPRFLTRSSPHYPFILTASHLLSYSALQSALQTIPPPHYHLLLHSLPPIHRFHFPSLWTQVMGREKAEKEAKQRQARDSGGALRSAVITQSLQPATPQNPLPTPPL